MKNLLVAKIFNNIADILELKDVQWKPQAYRKAALSIESLNEDIKDVYERGEIENIPGVGKHITLKIVEILKTGELKYYNKLKKEFKIDVESLNAIPGLGPKKIKILYKKLKVKDFADLQKVMKSGKLQRLSGFGEKTASIIKEGMEFVKTRPNRMLYAQAQPIVKFLKEELKSKYIQKLEVAGSFRRGKATIGDIDLLVISNNPMEVMKLFTSIKDCKILSKGLTKSSIRLDGLQIDLRVVKQREYGSALMYFIGNKQHNVELRKIAISKGYKLSEYGLFKGNRWVAGKTEVDIYKKLGLDFIPPEMRENTGEIQVARQHKLPSLITKINGVFHNHTKWSDGNDSLLAMAQKAEELKFKFISFNDHFGAVAIANPLDERRLAKYLKEIEKIRKKVGIRVFSGVEIDIMKNGSLSLPVKKLKELDVVVAAVHRSINLEEKEQTARVCKALENHVHILGHPTDKLLNKRKGLKLNLNKVFQKAKENDVSLGINTTPKRMDLQGYQIEAAIKKGCKLAIGTDAHATSQLEHYDLGIIQARRGWAETKDILNCWNLPKIEKTLRSKK